MKKGAFIVLVVINLTLLVVGIALPQWWEVDGVERNGSGVKLVELQGHFGLWRYCWEVRAVGGAHEDECGDTIGSDSAKLNRSIDAVAGLTLTVVVLHVLSVVVFAGGYGQRKRERVRLTAVIQVLAVVLGCIALGMASHARDVIEDELAKGGLGLDLDVTFGDSFILATTATIFNGLLAAAVLLFLCYLVRVGATRGHELGGSVGDRPGAAPLAAYDELEEGGMRLQGEAPGVDL